MTERDRRQMAMTNVEGTVIEKTQGRQRHRRRMADTDREDGGQTATGQTEGRQR